MVLDEITERMTITDETRDYYTVTCLTAKRIGFPEEIMPWLHEVLQCAFRGDDWEGYGDGPWKYVSLAASWSLQNLWHTYNREGHVFYESVEDALADVPSSGKGIPHRDLLRSCLRDLIIKYYGEGPFDGSKCTVKPGRVPIRTLAEGLDTAVSSLADTMRQYQLARRWGAA